MIENRPGEPQFSLEASLEKIAYDGQTNYCWSIDRKANNYDDIQGNDHVYIQTSRLRLVDQNDSASTTITPHIDRYPACIQSIKLKTE